MDTIICVVTGADITDNSVLKRRERYIEYMMSLFKIFSYTIPTYGVLSEYSSNSISEDSPPFSKFPFKIVKHIEAGVLDTYSKSQKEFSSIKALLEEMKSLEIDDSVFVIKITGRYLLIDDSFMNLVKANQSNPNVNSIIRLGDTGMQFTCLYALRYKYFREFYEQHVNAIPNGKCIEASCVEYLKDNNLFETTLLVDSLGILTNINSEGNFRIF